MAAVGATRDGTAERRRRAAIDVGLVAGVALALLALFLWPTLRDGHVFPVGPDVPVYLWWSRVATDGRLAAVGERPGIVALLPTVAGALRIGLVPALAGVMYAVGPAVGTAGAALVRGRRGGAIPRGAWVAGGLLAGVWATHLGDGYAANLAMAAPFIAAAVALARRSRRGTIGAAILLAGGGLMHPQFLIVGAVVLLLTAGWAALRERRLATPTGDAARVMAALGAGVGAAALGMWSASAGPVPIPGDTSKDALLRRIGAWDALRATFVDRFRMSWPRYAPIMNTLLDVAGALRGRGFPRRFLVSWLAFTLVAVATGVLTGWFPPDRVLTFAFCIPLLASLGLAWLAERLGRWWLAWPIGIVLGGPHGRADRPGLGGGAVVHLPRRAADDDARGPDRRDHPAGHAPRVRRRRPRDAGAVPRIARAERRARERPAGPRRGRVDRRSVAPRTSSPARRRRWASRSTTWRRPTRRRRSPTTRTRSCSWCRSSTPARVRLELPGLTRWDPGLAATLGPARPLPAAGEELAASGPGDIAGAAVRVLLLLTVVGAGWALWSIGDGPGALATAPAFGVATLGLAGFALERLGGGARDRGRRDARVSSRGRRRVRALAARPRPPPGAVGSVLLVERQPDPDA